MAIPISNVSRRVVYAASGTGPYAFTFEILANTDIAVYKDDLLLTLTTDYSVTINANGTGSITLVASPTGATQIAIVGNRTIQRTSDFVTGGDFFANTLNDELDQQTIFAQQNAEGLARALSAPQTDPTSVSMTLPRSSDRAGKYLGFDSNGNPIVSDIIPDSRYYGSLTTDPSTRPNGSAKESGDIYFNSTNGELRVYDAADQSWTAITRNAVGFRTALATAGQSLFNVTGGYVPGKIQVYVNGTLLYSPTDYTATNSTSITFTNGLSLNDEITVVVFKSMGSVAFQDITNITVSTNAPSGSAAEGEIWIRV